MENERKTAPAEPETESGREAQPAAGRPAYTPAQRLLLPGVLLIGIAWRWGCELTHANWYGVFWLVAMAVATVFLWKRVRQDRTALAVGAAAIALCVLMLAHGGRSELDVFLFALIPATMMLYLVFAAYEIPLRREGEAARRALAGVFVYPFKGIPQFFGAIGSLVSGRGHGAWKRALLGAALGIPLAAGVTLLLMQADANMRLLFERLLFDAPVWIGRGITVLLTAMLFFGVFNAAISRDQTPLAAARPADWPASTLTMLFIPLLAVYAIFACFQFGYLFGGVLPEELTYSEYAREGFMQLNVVAAINFTLLGLCWRYGVQTRTVRTLCALLLSATGMIVASSVVRLLLYIGAYGLTIWRVVPLWLAIFLAALTLLCAVRLIRRTFPVLRIGGLAFLYWYVLLNLPDWNAVIAAYNAAHGMG